MGTRTSYTSSTVLNAFAILAVINLKLFFSFPCEAAGQIERGAPQLGDWMTPLDLETIATTSFLAIDCRSPSSGSHGNQGERDE